MRAKTDMQARARELRRQGRTYGEIQAELGVARSSISLWVRDLPRPTRRPAGPKASQTRVVRRAEKRKQEVAAASAEIGRLSDRELFLVGVALYWAEGAKPRPDARVIFVNSDPNVIRLFEAWLDLLGVPRGDRRYTVAIHETADVAAAESYWATLVGVDAATFQKPSVKRHNPRTNRKNVGEAYRGCLRVTVLRSAALYWQIEAWWSGMVVEVRARNP